MGINLGFRLCPGIFLRLTTTSVCSFRREAGARSPWRADWTQSLPCPAAGARTPRSQDLPVGLGLQFSGRDGAWGSDRQQARHRQSTLVPVGCSSFPHAGSGGVGQAPGAAQKLHRPVRRAGPGGAKLSQSRRPPPALPPLRSPSCLDFGVFPHNEPCQCTRLFRSDFCPHMGTRAKGYGLEQVSASPSTRSILREDRVRPPRQFQALVCGLGHSPGRPKGSRVQIRLYFVLRSRAPGPWTAERWISEKALVSQALNSAPLNSTVSSGGGNSILPRGGCTPRTENPQTSRRDPQAFLPFPPQALQKVIARTSGT
ncbi:uncharacterized protein [Symphalangus syndactylus]|uniref:uncharacterized protein isoform X1 n=1 Tax=Symphalangus syndactylus TaxID=9590 RepID=UPI003006F658